MNKLLLLIPFLFACQPQRSSQPLSNYLNGEYSVYRVEINGESDYYFNANTFQSFLSTYSAISGNIFDFDGNGVVGSSDLATALTGYGDTYNADYDVESAQVLGQFSSGWIIDLDGWDVVFLKVTPSDEGGEFIPESLNSFFIEGERGGATWKVWYYVD